MMKHIYLLIAIVLICSCSHRQEREQRAPIRVETMQLSSDGVVDSHTFVGIVEESEATAVSFTGMGVVKRVVVSEGQAVGRGQLIAIMDDTQARNLLAGAQAQMAQANDAQTRYKMLYDNGSLPEAQWVEVQSKVAQAKSQLDMAKKNLADCRLVAPVGGIIGKKYISAGETAMPSQAVVSIVDISKVKVKVSIPETEVGSIRASTPTTIKVEATGGSYQGQRIEKGVQADALTHTYDVRVSVVNSDRRLLPGMVANVRFFTGNNTEASGIQVPVTSVQRRADGSLFVWTTDKNKKTHRTSVKIGKVHGNNVTITSGLKVGDRIVTEGFQKLSENTNVVF